MKQPNDTHTPELHLDGQPAFELDHAQPWTLPPVKPYTPAPRDTKQLQEWGQRLERWAQRRLAA